MAPRDQMSLLVQTRGGFNPRMRMEVGSIYCRSAVVMTARHHLDEYLEVQELLLLLMRCH